MSDETEPASSEAAAKPPLNGGVFVGSRDPAWDLEHERPWHRLAAHLFSTGDTVKGVANKMGKSLPAVHNLLRQPWFQKLVTTLMAESGAKDISKLLMAEQFNNYSVMVTMRDDPNTPAALRLRAAQDMMDRALGKATQRLEVARETVSDDPVAEFDKLEKENRRLRNELNQQAPVGCGHPDSEPQQVPEGDGHIKP